MFVAMLFHVVTLSMGCDTAGDDADDDGRIVIGVSVDRVPLGVDTLLARNILGRPSAIQREPGSIVYRYTSGPHAGFSIHFSIDQNRRVEERTVFSLAAPYSGRTSDGVGVGTQRSRVLQSLGAADVSGIGTSGFIHDRYRTDDAETGFLYDADEEIISITMNGPIR